MTDEKDLGRELLKENGIEPGEVSGDTITELTARIAREKERARIVKLGALIGFVVLLPVLVFLRGVSADLVGTMGLFVLVGVPIFLWAVGLYFGQRQIQASLTHISAQLERLARNQQAAPRE